MLLKKLLLLLLVFVITVCVFPQNNFFSTRGQEILDINGSPVQLKGTNLGNWLVPEGYMFKFGAVSSPRLINQAITELIGPDAACDFWKKFRDNYITREDIHFIKNLGFNSIRVPFNFRLFASEEYPEITIPVGFEMLDRVIKWCKEEQLYVILDMHCAPGGQTGDNIDDSWGYPYLFENEESQVLAIKIWKSIAERYANENIIIGYDLLNEPIAHYFDTAKLNPLLEPFYKRLVTEIRTVDKNHIMFLGGAQWDGNFDVFGKPFDSKLVYTFHKYWSEPTKNVIQPYLDFSSKYNVPLYMGESGENTDEWITAFREMLDSNKVSWHFWPYKKLDATAGIVSIKRTDEYDAVIKFVTGDRSNYEKIRQNKPDALTIKKALDDFLENCRLKNCIINKGYIKALGVEDIK